MSLIITKPVSLSSALTQKGCPIVSVTLDVAQIAQFRVACHDFLAQTGFTSASLSGFQFQNPPTFLDKGGNEINPDLSDYSIDLKYMGGDVFSVAWGSTVNINEWFFTLVGGMDFYQDTGRFLP